MPAISVVVALILHQQLAAIDAPASAGAIDAAFAHTFTWTPGFLAVALAIVLFLPAGPPPSPPSTDTPNPETRTTT
jgi:hypothetical protein